jgi:AcrR family transcriptional regulator
MCSVYLAKYGTTGSGCKRFAGDRSATRLTRRRPAQPRAHAQAARTVFQRDGLSAQMDAIADEAGLGVGTLYRHFPTREALIDVLIAERAQQLLTGAKSAADNADPWSAVEDLVWRFAAFVAEDRGMADILSDYRSRAMDAPDAPVAARSPALRQPA